MGNSQSSKIRFKPNRKPSTQASHQLLHKMKSQPGKQGSWGQHGAHLGPVGPMWVPCRSHEPCAQGMLLYCDRRGKYRIMYVLKWKNVYAHTRGLFWCLLPELCSNEGNTHQINTSVSTYTVRDEITYIISFPTKHNGSINDDKTTIFTHRLRDPLAQFTFC